MSRNYINQKIDLDVSFKISSLLVSSLVTQKRM